MMATRKATKRLLFMGDTHCGAVTGLLPPQYQSEETEPVAGPLWTWYSETVAEIGPVDALCLTGDLVDGPGVKDLGNGHVSTDTEEQANIAASALAIVKARRTYAVYGTPYHTVTTWSAENMVARLIGARIADSQYLQVYGRRISIRHVVGRSDTPYGQGTLAHKELIRDLMTALQDRQEPADIVVRGHVHTYAAIDDGDRWGIIVPALQLPGSVFGRTQRPWRYRVGMVLLEISPDGAVNMQRRLMPLELVRKREYARV